MVKRSWQQYLLRKEKQHYINMADYKGLTKILLLRRYIVRAHRSNSEDGERALALLAIYPWEDQFNKKFNCKVGFTRSIPTNSIILNIMTFPPHL